MRATGGWRVRGDRCVEGEGSSIDNLIKSTVKERETDRWVEGEGDRWL